MPRYFFNLSNGIRHLDMDGTVLQDAEEARQQAIVAAGAIFSEDGDMLESGDTVTFSIVDDAGFVFCTIEFTIRDVEAASRLQQLGSVKQPRTAR